jgi:hypothetical protein
LLIMWHKMHNLGSAALSYDCGIMRHKMQNLGNAVLSNDCDTLSEEYMYLDT